MRLLRYLSAMVFSLSVAGCVVLDVGPINKQTAQIDRTSPEFIPDADDDGSTVVGLAFSGGGMRAAAFAYGVLRELDETVIDEHPSRRTLVDNVRFVSGASGGAVAAAYFGYKGRDGYRDFRERFLIVDAEENLRTSVSPINLLRAAKGGVNDRSGFSGWLTENLFGEATFRDLQWPGAPTVWINASDIFNGTPFLFTHDTFAALCSDLDEVRLSDAVAASAAVPIVFAPIVLTAVEPKCAYKRPKWLERALADPQASLRLQAYSKALRSYQEKDNLNYVKLLDGALTDNIGVTGFTLERSASETPYGPLSPEAAVKLRTLLFLVADSGREIDVEWAIGVKGPTARPLLGALTNTTISAATRDAFDAMKLAMGEWRHELIDYRCGLPAETVRRYRGTLAGWNCRDITLVAEHLSFSDLDEPTRLAMNGVPTRFTLPAESVDSIIEAGRTALQTNVAFRKAIADTKRHAGVGRAKPVTP